MLEIGIREVRGPVSFKNGELQKLSLSGYKVHIVTTKTQVVQYLDVFVKASRSGATCLGEPITTYEFQAPSDFKASEFETKIRSL